MVDRLLGIASREWIGLAIGGAVALAGIALARWAPIGGVPLAGFGLLLMAGSIVHLARLRHTARRFPAPGKLVAVDRTRIHLLAEGRADDTLPVVWLGGGHSAGLAMIHLHQVLRDKTRSILIDRPGTGWSDTGPFPRRTEFEAEEIPAALRAAGEMGPFVFVGYSFGGLLAANIARRYPEMVARLVLLDATPLETLVFGPRLGVLRTMRRDALLSGLLRLFGMPANLSQRRIARERPAATNSDFERALGPYFQTLVAIEASAGSQFAAYSSYQDLIGPSVAARGWEMSVYDGDLGDLELWLVAPGSSDEVMAEKEVAGAGAEQERMVRFFARSRERYLAASSNSRRIVTPPGTTHQFVYEAPAFVANLIEEAVALPTSKGPRHE